MKKSILVISLMTVAMAVFAIDYPTYKPTTPIYGGGGSTGNGNSGTTETTYGGYSTTTSGGVTTYGEGAAVGPRRTNWGTNDPQNPQEGDTKIEDGKQWVYLNGDWVLDGNYHAPDVDQSDQSPVGTPWIMLLFAAMAAGVVAVRRRKAMAVVALLLVCGQGWAYEFVDGGQSGNDAVRWSNGETFTIVFVDNTKSAQFQNAGGANGNIDVNSVASKVVTFSSETTWQRTNENFDVFHWQTSSYNWTHGSQEWYKFSTKGKKTATNEFPIPDRTGYTTLTITLDGSGNSVFTWSGGSDPAPTPSGDHKIDGCDGCFLVEE